MILKTKIRKLLIFTHVFYTNIQDFENIICTFELMENQIKVNDFHE